jgi:ribulose bisphosphate carboxylase small subunit
MISPLHRKLIDRRSLSDMADILEDHIGDGTDAKLCSEALTALRRFRDDSQNHYVRSALRVLDDSSPSCEIVRKVIDALRSWRYFSGA